MKSCQWQDSEASYPIVVQSDAKTGHLIYESNKFTQVNKKSVEILIVGGGIAGLSAANALKERDFLLCELSDHLGGTSSAFQDDKFYYAQGAHYDLAYPSNYGLEVIQLFEDLGIVKYQSWNDRWGFVDEQHLITHRRKNQCYDHGVIRKDVLPEGPIKEKFLELIAMYNRVMPLPSRLIPSKYHYLNQITFADFLGSNLKPDKSFLNGLSYHMKDDYGSDVYSVSALAGIHYFACRPYYDEIVELFSPPEGNHYFISKMSHSLNREQLLTGHLVRRINKTNSGFEVEIVDIDGQKVKLVNTRKIIYAGQKHALKYIYQEDAKLFEDNNYAPWMVVNVAIKNELNQIGYWQNEMLTDDETFLGFVDSDAQVRDAEYRVFTAYYCLPPTSRNDLMNVEANKKNIAEKTINYINAYFKEDISEFVQQVSIKVMGHAMPIPGKGYLFNDKNELRKNKNIAYAGVDNSRLPLLYEAVDSGLIAAKVCING